MSDNKIKGGYILQPRILDKSNIMKSPPIVRELWFYLLRKVNWKDGKLPRGTGFFQFEDIQNDLCWYVGFRKMKYSKPQISKALRRICEENMTETMKATRGVIITVLNYNHYQEPKNYEGNDEETTKETDGQHYNKRKIYKKEKELYNKTCFNKQVSFPNGKQNKLVKRDKSKPIITKKETSYSSKTKHIVDYYYSSDFKNQPALTTKIAEHINNKLNRLFRGTLFNKENSLKQYHSKKFTRKEIKMIIDRHSTKAIDNSFKPRKKEFLLVHLDIFLYNEYGKNKSLFIDSFENEPEPITIVTKDKNPELSKALFKIYNKEAQNGLSVYSYDTLPTKNKNNFINGAFKLNKFLKLNQEKLVSVMLSSHEKKAEMLWKTIMLCANNDIKKITPYWFQADWVFDKLPNYMVDRGFSQEKEEINPMRIQYD